MLQTLFLKLLIIINGLGAASAIQYHKEKVYLISDDQVNIYQYDFKKQKQDIIDIQFSNSNNLVLAKKDKLDFEAMLLHKNKLYMIGSGSTKKRSKMFVYDLNNKSTHMQDIANVYESIQKQFHLDQQDFNIEGIAYTKGFTYLLNRGNGKNKINAIIKIKGLPDKLDLTKMEFIKVDLPIVSGIQTTFSDGLILDHHLIFTATVEDNSTVYKDGLIKESIIGKINLSNYQVTNYKIITTNQKIEGITLKSKNKTEYEFLFCEDNDDNANASKIYTLKLSKDLTELN